MAVLLSVSQAAYLELSTRAEVERCRSAAMPQSGASRRAWERGSTRLRAATRPAPILLPRIPPRCINPRRRPRHQPPTPWRSLPRVRPSTTTSRRVCMHAQNTEPPS